MITAILNFLFGCSHGNYSWPQGNGRIKYCSCLECGKDLAYDWQQMKIVKPSGDGLRISEAGQVQEN